jgi:hypothetical protein
VASPDIIVTTTSDVADFGGAHQVADLPGTDGEVSLREAIDAANNTGGPQVIGLNIPTDDPGFAGGVFTIQPNPELPTLSGGGTTIDGSSQADFTGNTNPAGPEIVINGALLPPETSGLRINSADNRIHALVVNGIQGPCCGSAIDIAGAEATGNVVSGCFIGLAPNGASVVPDVNAAIGIGEGASNTLIGGTTPQARNVIAGSGFAGIAISSDHNLVQGNFIGTDATGTQALGNGFAGVTFGGGASNNIVGGPHSSTRNVISANGTGVFIGTTENGAPSSNTIQGNFIGTDVSGRHPLGNGEDGIRIVSNVDAIPTLTTDHRIIGNLVSANAVNGVGIFTASDNVIQGNRIGTDVAGRPVLGNGEFGVFVISNAETGDISRGNLIGGTGLLHVNIIAGNVDAGVLLDAENTLVRQNVIFNNGGPGVRVDARLGNKMSRNSMLLNGGLGIDLDAGSTGVTPNDPGDVDGGPNNFQNFPGLTTATIQGNRLRVAGTIDTPNPTTVVIEFFANPVPVPGADPSGHGEGAVFLGTVNPNAAGMFNATLPRVRPGTLISATATDAAGNTSEFSANTAVEGGAGGHDD